MPVSTGIAGGGAASGPVYGPELYGTSDEYSQLAWRFTERRDGEIAEYSVGGLHVWVRDYDGDVTDWRIRKDARGPILAEGNRYDGRHFFEALRDAEQALRRIVAERIAELRARSASGTAARSAETSGLGPKGHGPAGAAGDAQLAHTPRNPGGSP